jgi:hypothetical protein
LYVADCGNYTIRKITPQGTNWVVTTVAGLAGTNGAADGTNSDARFYNPYNLTVDGSGNLFVADNSNSTVRKITPMGTNWVVTTIAGIAQSYGYADGFGTNARFCGVGGITIDKKGRLYVAESVNCTIRKLTPIGGEWLVTTLGGTPGINGTQDGVGAAAQFYPWNVAVDDVGTLYVADEWNYTVRRGEVAMVLRAARLGNQLVLSWPNSASNYVLECSATLAPDAVWNTMTNLSSSYGDDLFTTNATGTAPAFIRLRK